MTDQHHRDQLAQLRAEVTALRARVDRPRRRFQHRLLPLAVVTLLVAFMPLSILAANPVFSDLGTAAPVHQPNIQALGNAGITTGYDDPDIADPDYRLYDPTGLVTREQMASFLARTAGLGGNPPVANAANANQLGGVAAANYIQTETSATLANITVTGAINGSFTNGTTNRATPIAYAQITPEGAVQSGTPNVSATYNEPFKRYEITIADVAFTTNGYQVIATAIGETPRMISVGALGLTKMTVHIANADGTLVADNFSFVVFKP